MTKRSNRVLHITLKKSGSQWVRDILSAPEIVAYSGLPHSGIVPNFANCRELELPPRTFNGPIYGMNLQEWRFFKRPGDKAVVVLRDPRDVIISWMFSLMYSHASSAQVDVARRLLHALPDEKTRIMHLIHHSGLGGTHRLYRTWLELGDEDALVVRYEDLIKDEYAEFTKIIKWLGWVLPREILEPVIERLSFEARSGRKSGVSDKFSHYRRGVAGDWSNYFTRKHGEIWEQMYPGFLCDIGYEENNNWWCSLPEQHSFDVNAGGLIQTASEENLVAVLEKRLQQTQRELIEKEQVIQELVHARNFAELTSNNELTSGGVIARWFSKLVN